MLRLIGHRLIASVLLLFVVSVLAFVLVTLVPGDPALTILGPQAIESQLEALRHQMALDAPLWEQYWRWLEGVLHGDLGSSLFNGQSVKSLLDERLPVSLSLIVGGTVMAALIGITLGTVGALRGGIIARALDVFTMFGLAVPNFWLALVLIAAFAVAVPMFPATGYVPFAESRLGWARSLVLPVVTLALGGMTVVAKQTRDSMLDTLDRDFIRVMQGNGFSRRSIIYRHALRNASIPVVTVLGIVFVGLLSASVLVESIFALPGLGSLAVQATLQHDLPVIQGAVVYFTLLVVAVNLVVDVAYGWLDPRVRVR